MIIPKTALSYTGIFASKPLYAFIALSGPSEMTAAAAFAAASTTRSMTARVSGSNLARLADAELAHGEIDIVLDYDKVGRSRVMVLDDRRDRLAREVHEGLGLYKQDALARKSRPRHEALELPLLLPDRTTLGGNAVNDFETYRVRSISVLRTRVPKSDYDLQPFNPSTFQLFNLTHD